MRYRGPATSCNRAFSLVLSKKSGCVIERCGRRHRFKTPEEHFAVAFRGQAWIAEHNDAVVILVAQQSTGALLHCQHRLWQLMLSETIATFTTNELEPRHHQGVRRGCERQFVDRDNGQGLAANIDAIGDTRSLPVVGLPIPESLESLAMLMTELRYGLDFDDYNRLAAADQIAAPTLIYQGGMDTTVAPSVARDLAVAMGATATLVEQPEAQHVGSWNVDPEAYAAAMQEFLTGSGL